MGILKDIDLQFQEFARLQALYFERELEILNLLMLSHPEYNYKDSEGNIFKATSVGQALAPSRLWVVITREEKPDAGQ